ncbi:hypothetical protein SPI_04789 [Niveomyces insectorum RCEF 264]|uniref:Uncharacterized protein n=1 Tax=Niveomyces insectorum RCEF 264 TaxID=1081102 RepID=A0A167UUQ4_9HYPO|nr:hypothetical protein SPI_04789 [Niveomyces insectorum RCEF 264]
MAEGTDSSSLLGALQAMQAQQARLAAEVKQIIARDGPDHAQDTDAAGSVQTKTTDATETRNGTAAPPRAAVASADDHPMTDAADKIAKGLSRRCYDDILTLVHDTFAASTSQQQELGFASRPTFLAELDAVLADVRSLRAPLSRIDDWLAAQKRAWLLDQLRDDVGVTALGAAHSGSRAAFRGQLTAAAFGDGATTATTATDAAKLLRTLLSDGDSAEASDLVQRLKTAATATERGSVYRDVVFPHGVPDVPAAQALAKRLAEGRVGLAQGLKEAVRELGGLDNDGDGDDTNSSNNSNNNTAQIEKHRKRLAELRRAKAAHEAQKLKKMKPVEVPYFLQEDTPCAACGRAADPQTSLFCTVCFLEVDSCLRADPTLWCSRACMAAAYPQHAATAHPCAAGDRCARARPEQGLARQEPRYCFCRECMRSFGIGTFYCTDRCAGRDFQRHREAVHLPHRALRADEHDDRADLSYSGRPGGTATSYTAADLAKHVLPVPEAFAGCQTKHPDWALKETPVAVVLPYAA